MSHVETSIGNPVRALLGSTPVLPVVVIEDLETAAPLAEALHRGGLPLIEVTLRTPVALQAIERIRIAVPDMTVGAGSVMGPQQLEAAAKAGAAFAVSPGATRSLLRAGRRSPIPLLPGVASASDIMTAVEWGYSELKFFPAEVAGGPAALRSFAGPFPTVSFCPTGGIGPETAGRYLALSNVMAVGGSWMANPADVRRGDWNKVEAAARAAALLGRP